MTSNCDSLDNLEHGLVASESWLAGWFLIHHVGDEGGKIFWVDTGYARCLMGILSLWFFGFEFRVSGPNVLAEDSLVRVFVRIRIFESILP